MNAENHRTSVRAKTVNQSRILALSVLLMVQIGCAMSAKNSESIGVVDAAGDTGNTAIFVIQREVVSLSENPLQHAIQRHVKERTAFLFEMEHREATHPPKLTTLGRYDSTLWLDREVTSGSPDYGILKSPKATLVDMGEVHRRLSAIPCEYINTIFVSDGSVIHQCDNELSVYEGASLNVAFNAKVDEMAEEKTAKNDENAEFNAYSRPPYSTAQIAVDEGSVYIISHAIENQDWGTSERSIRVRVANKVNKEAITLDMPIAHGESFVDFKPDGWIVLGVAGEGYPNKFRIENIKNFKHSQWSGFLYPAIS